MHGQVFTCAPTGRRRSCGLISVARVDLSSRRGTNRQVAREYRPTRRSPPSRVGAGSRASPAGEGSDRHTQAGCATPGARILQRRGGFDADARVRHHPWRGTMDAGAVDQRHRQPRFPDASCPGGRGLHLVGEQPGEPAHGVVERPGARTADVLFVTGVRRTVESDAAAHPRRDWQYVDGTARLLAMRARCPRHRARPVAVRAG